ncbi:Por secretion system C-terminal sorting domain-containing protein [Ekhidna lutea]|uniref:Por secretion system C-terminal sorting domain-containing protein n=1 Tax=Ekhidna lutea TaxID=447679 RepID=A0A239K7V1_EKHLU|nr:PKD domain-containing protein [Ekhidna lutea]SNT14546.1 Por secretion system C-terminal sorting domain-containing protein [Ekhidna lutea]
MRGFKKLGLLSFLAALLTGTAIFSVLQKPSHPFQEYLDMSKTELNELEKYDRPDLADLHDFEMTKDPALGFPPSERLFTAKDYANNLMTRSRAASSEWTERGPNNFGGRTRAIMFDPNDSFNKKVWAAGVGGGLWYNNDITDQYSSWSAVNDFFGNIAINSIAYDPNNTEVFYFGTGEGWGNADAARGNGIWKSTDAGVSWTQIASTKDNAEFYYVQKIVVTEESTVLAATRNSGGILRSVDGGDTWEQVVAEDRGADIEIVGNIIYASTGISTTGKMWKSIDDGLTWDEITPESGKNRIEIGVHPNHPNTVYAVAAQGSNVGGFYRSYDAGESWKSVTIPAYIDQNCNESSNDFTRGQAWYDLILAVDPVDKNTLIAGGIDISKSTDGGENWDLISYWTGACDDYVHADQHNFIFRPGHPDFAIASTDGGIYFTETFSRSIEDGGPIFTARNNDYNVAQFYACAVENTAGSNYFLAGAQDNGSHQFFNAGINSTNEITGGDGAFCFIDKDDSDIQITSYVYNSYWITRDFWDSNSRVEFGSSVGRFINPADYADDDNILYAAGDGDQMIKYEIPASGDIEAEELQLSLNEGVISAVTVSKYDNSIVFVGTGLGEIYKVTDASTTPTATKISTSTIPENVYISSIDVGSDNDHLIATASNYGIESVFFTQDGGTTWNSKEGNLPDMPIRGAIFNPSNYEEVMLATELGVWTTSAISDASPVWTVANDGLANVRCDMLQMREADGLIAVATHGRGLYTSDMWATVSTPLFTTVDLAYEGSEIKFYDGSVKADSYLWDFGDGTTSTLQNPSHTYGSSGAFTVSLEINGDAALTTSKTITVLPNLSTSYSLSDGGNFDVNTSHFNAVTIAGTGFELGSSTVSGKSGTNSGENAWVTGLDEAQYEANGEAYLYSPSFDFSISGEYTIEFYTKYEIEDEWEGFTIEYSTDQGLSWKKLGDYLDADTWYNQQALASAVVWTPGENFFSGDTGDEFVRKSMTTSDLSNNSNVSFRFVFKTDPGTEEAGVAIDDFSITAPSETTPDLGIKALADICLGEVLIVENESVGQVDLYTWDFGAGATPSSAVGYGPHEVLYATEGEKTIQLTGSTGSGDISVSASVEIFAFPDAPIVSEDVFDLCAQEEALIEITNSKVDVNYSLYSLDDKDFVGESVAGNDGTITISSGALESGTYEYRVVAANQNDCQVSGDLISVEAKENPPVVIIELTKNQLKASPGDSYQWYLNGNEIDGATEIEYTATEAGEYTVEVTFGNCVSVSEPYSISTVLGLTDDVLINIYPNPVSEKFEIEHSDKVISVVLYSMDGKAMIPQKFNNYYIISDLPVGIYNVSIRTTEQILNKRLIKK